MPSPKITKAQAEKQKAALIAHNEKRRAAGTIGKQAGLSTRIKTLLDAALETISKVANGVPEGEVYPSKTQLDNAWKIVNTVMTTEKHDKEIRIKRLDLKKKIAEANVAGYGDRTPAKVKEHFEQEGLKEVPTGFAYNADWDVVEEVLEDDEDFSEDDENDE